MPPIRRLTPADYPNGMPGGFLEEPEENHGKMNWDKVETRITLLFFYLGRRRFGGQKNTEEHKKIAEFFTGDHPTHRAIAERLVKDEGKALKLQKSLGVIPAWKKERVKRKVDGEGVEEDKAAKKVKVEEAKKAKAEQRRVERERKKAERGKTKREAEERRKSAGVKKPGPKSGRTKSEAPVMLKKLVAGAIKDGGRKVAEETVANLAESEESEEVSGEQDLIMSGALQD